MVAGTQVAKASPFPVAVCGKHSAGTEGSTGDSVRHSCSGVAQTPAMCGALKGTGLHPLVLGDHSQPGIDLCLGGY